MNSKVAYSVPIQGTDNPFQVEEMIKGSRFIGRLIFSPDVKTAKDFIRQLNLNEPEATHHCWAYIIGNPQSTTLIACSDDGEPSGTAGMPMLNVLKHSGVGDITAVVTRYYGGTKLGTGGLARAYGGSIKLAMKTLPRQERLFTDKVTIECSYDLQNQVEYLLKEHQGLITDCQFSNRVAISAEVPQDRWPDLQQALAAYQNKNLLEVIHVPGA